ncbi:MAG: hypothetical protein RRX92_09035 [Lachnospiraceae bacterium]
MVENHDMPLGFTMNLAQNMTAIGQFAGLSTKEKEQAAHRAQSIQTQEEMKLYVDSIAKSTWTR